MEQMLGEIVGIALTAAAEVGKPGDIGLMEAAKKAIVHQMLDKTLDKLQIQPDAKALQQIQERLFGYVPMVGADIKKREAGDFSEPDIRAKAPPLPKAQLTFERLVEAWVADAGGITEQDGVGVSEDRRSAYRRSIEDLIAVTGCHYPAEVRIEEARKYYEHLQASSWAIGTKQKRLGTLNNLFSLAVQLALLDANPFSEFKLKIPKGTRYLAIARLVVKS